MFGEPCRGLHMIFTAAAHDPEHDTSQKARDVVPVGNQVLTRPLCAAEMTPHKATRVTTVAKKKQLKHVPYQIICSLHA